jgi:MFS family permease
MKDFSENVIKEVEETTTMEDFNEIVIKETEGEMQPMKVKTEEAHSSSSKWGEWLNRSVHYPRRYKLIDDKDARKKSMLTLQFAVMVSAINTKMLNPNYAIMASPGLSPDSFPDTDPFNFNSATYFLPMMSLLGVAIASLFLGTLSDRAGRKRIMLVLAMISGAGSIAKYFARETFWGFCITQLVFGFFLGNLPIAMAYIGDVYTSKTEKGRQLSIIVANYVMGNSGGGIIAILMQDSGLFAPLWVGAGLMFLSAITIYVWLIEPGDARLQPIGQNYVAQEKDDEEDTPRPEQIDQRTMWNIVGGALADNFGSTALFPLCLSPLALETYTIAFEDRDEDPLMTVVGYQWLSVCVAFMVVPSTFVTPYIFARLGIAGTCVVGNAFTAILTMALLLIASYGVRSCARVSLCHFSFSFFSFFFAFLTASQHSWICDLCSDDVCWFPYYSLEPAYYWPHVGTIFWRSAGLLESAHFS